MNLAEAANLLLTLRLDDKVSSALKGIDKNIDRTKGKAYLLGVGLGKIGVGVGTALKRSALIGVAGIGLLARQIDLGIDSLVELEDVTLQTNAVLESTKGIAGLTAEEIRGMSEAFEDLTTIDDKVVQSGANILLTFTKIKEDAFEPALQAALDMSVAMDMDLSSAALSVGKALNDPVRGLTALRKQGIQFTEEQEAVIRSLVETGDVAGAQEIILQELATEFGGSSTEAAKGYRGTQERLKDTIEGLRMSLAEALLPALEKVSTKLREWLQSPAVKTGIKDLGTAIAGLFSDENIEGGVDTLKGVFTFLKELPWDKIRDGLGFAAENAKKVVDVFRSLPPGVQAGLLTFLAANKLSGGLIASGLGELLKVGLSSLKTITAANVTVIGANVTGGGVPSVKPGVGPVAGPLALLGGAAFVAALPFLVNGDTIQTSDKTVDQRLLDVNQAIAFWESRADSDPKKAATLETLRATKIALQQGNIDLADRLMGIRTAISGATTTVDFQAERIREALRLQLGETRTSAGTAAKSLAELDEIGWYSKITAKKPTNINVDVRTTFRVSAREVANAMDHYGFIAEGRGELE